MLTIAQSKISEFTLSGVLKNASVHNIENLSDNLLDTQLVHYTNVINSFLDHQQSIIFCAVQQGVKKEGIIYVWGLD